MQPTRRATPNDAPALAEVWNAAYPERPTTADAFTARLEAGLSDPTSGYLLAYPAGYVQYSLSQREGDPVGKYWAYLTLAKASPGEGGEDTIRALYWALLEHLRPLGARHLFTMANETQRASFEVLSRLGFQETLRSSGANLEVATTDTSAYGEPEKALAAQGIYIRTLAELERDPTYTPDLNAKLHALYLDTNRDVPEVGHSDTMNPDAFAEHLKRDDLLPDAYFIALHEGAFIGYSELFRGEAGTLRQETTAVRRAYRRRGVALALKLRGVAYAKAQRAERINTGMASNNLPMVRLNTRLGFVAEPAWITLTKSISGPT